jgi:hypothetical protein
MNHSGILNIQQIQGNPDVLHGKLIAYATVDVEAKNPSSSSPLNSLASNGILAIQANYIDQRNIKDFFESELGVSMEKGIQDIIEQAKDSEGLEGALDPEIVREKLSSMRNMEFIPIPAKVTFFDSIESIKEQEGDIYFLGHYQGLHHAHLSINSFPIMYQARFREQEHLQVSQEIEQMLQGFSTKSTSTHQVEIKEDIPLGEPFKNHVLKTLIPNILYQLENEGNDLVTTQNEFQTFMKDYPEEAKTILGLIDKNMHKDDRKLQKIQLILDQIIALQQEDYEAINRIKQDLKKLDT